MHSLYVLVAAAAFVAPAFGAPGAVRPPTSTDAAPAASNVPSSTAAPSANGQVPAFPSADFVQQVVNLPSQLQRQKLVGADNFKFSFANPPVAPPNPNAPAPGPGGKIVTANRASFPALIGNGISMAVATLNPCGFNLPHVHPRGTEALLVVKGEVKTDMILENGAEPISTDLKEMEMTVFPQGSLHLNFNPTCEKVTFVAGFNVEDAGVDTVTTNLFRFKDEEIIASFGQALFGDAVEGADLEKFRKNLPVNLANGVESCLKACNIKKNSYGYGN